MSDQPRVRTGQYTFPEHKEPALALGSTERAARVKELARPFDYPVGSRAMTGGDFGTIVEAPEHKGRLTLKLDGSGSVIAKPADVVPWDTHLDLVMPAVEYNPDPHTEEVPAEDADRMLRGSLVAMRNGLDSKHRTGSHYFEGVAAGEAEVAAALLNRDADPDMIEYKARELLALGPADLMTSEIKKNAAAPLSSVRARRLAGHLTSRAVEIQEELGAKPQNDWDSADWVKQGTKLAVSNAAVRFADGVPPTANHARHFEDRFAQLVMEGQTNTDTIIGETFDENAW
jgi:hypothetical protein